MILIAFTGYSGDTDPPCPVMLTPPQGLWFRELE